MSLASSDGTGARTRDSVAGKERRIAARIAKAMPADVKRYFVRKYNAHAESAFRQLLTGSDHVCEKCQCHRPSHHGVRMFLEMAGAVGTPGQILIANFLDKVGARDEVEARTLVASGRRMEQLSADVDSSLDALVSNALAVLKHAIAHEPERRMVIARELLGVDSIPLADTNGHANGNGAHE